VEEARGAVTDDCGRGLTTPLDVKQGVVLIASNGVKHGEILRYLQWCGEK